MSLQIIEMLIPTSNTFTRPRIKREPKSITIHETANTSVRANALAHARLQANGNRRQASWNYTVDDEPEVYLSIPENEITYHAGNAKGNRESISIEICVNQDGNYKKAVSNAIKLVRYLIEKYPSITEVNVVQHHYWSGKDCPRYLRAGTKGIDWNAFIEGVKTGKAEVKNPSKAPNYKQTSGNFTVGQKVTLKQSATHYATGERIPNQYKGKQYTVQQRGSNRILLKELYSWVHTSDLEGGKVQEKKPTTTTIQSSSSYKGDSIVDYLNSIKVDSSPANRRKLAREYGISNYDLSAKKNLELLNAMRSGKKPTSSSSSSSSNVTSYKGESIVDYLNLKGNSHLGGSSFDNRKRLARQHGISNYRGKEEQNIRLLNILRGGSSSSSSKTSQKPSFSVGSKVTIKNSAKKYATGENIPSRYKGKSYTIQQVKSDRVLLKELYSWVRKTDLS